MHNLLKGTTFRERVVEYIRANLRSYLPGLDSAEAVQKIPIEREAACQGPPSPDREHPEYDRLLKEEELRLARTEQLHTCKPRRCLILNCRGQVHCKRGALFPCSEEDFADENGLWGSKRMYGYMNTWIPAILVNARCNNDSKLLTNGRDTKNIAYYVASYAAKKQGPSYNTSAVFAEGFNYYVNHPQISICWPAERKRVIRDCHLAHRERHCHRCRRRREIWFVYLRFGPLNAEACVKRIGDSVTAPYKPSIFQSV